MPIGKTLRSTITTFVVAVTVLVRHHPVVLSERKNNAVADLLNVLQF